MKKHIVGLTLFSFIVVAAAIVYSMFSLSQVEEVPAPADYQHYSSKTSCWKMKSKSNVASPFVNQAVFNAKTKRFSWYLSKSETSSSILLHFFVSDAKGIRYIDSVPADGLKGDGELNYSPFYMELNKLDSQANFYLITEVDTLLPYKNFNEYSRAVAFDASKAIAVTINYGK